MADRRKMIGGCRAFVIVVCAFVGLLLVTLPTTACDRCIHHSNATLFSSAPVPGSGACGYGSLAQGFNSGRFAAVAPSIYKQGVACGACFQIRCKDEGGICSEQGTSVMVTGENPHNTPEFVLSRRALVGMANKGRGNHILKLAHLLQVEYKRVPCEYTKKKNLSIRVQEWSSQKRQFLSITFLDQGGQTEIVAVDVAEAGGYNWKYMSRNSKYGAVWETSTVPEGALQFRFVVTAGYDGKYYWAKNVLPADWKPGVTYDSGLQITDVAQEACSPCA